MLVKSTVIAALALTTVSAQVGPWGQCGGQGYTGSTTCQSGWTCTFSNTWYSQCLQGSGGGNQQTTTTRPPTQTTTNAPQPTQGGNTSQSIDARIKAKGKEFWGNILDGNTINNSVVTNILKANFGQITAENAFKWDATERTRGQFTFSGSDAVANWARSNGKALRGHTYLWHAQLPSWVSSIGDRATLTTVIQNHINGLGGRYKGKTHSWDVVNEILNEQGGMRDSVFSRVLGEDFVRVAFEAARTVDSASRRCINDYNLDSATYGKTVGMVNNVKKWKSQGVPIDCIGSQAHLGAGGGNNAAGAINKLAEAGVDVYITELDIAGASSDDYTKVTRACLNQARCRGITSWGVRDSDSWRGASSAVCLFDGSGNKKAAYNAVLSALA